MKGFSNVHQLGFVVENLREAMKEYGEIYGIKQWYGVVNKPQGQLYYKGKPFFDRGYRMAIGYCGRTEIELITTGADENIYTEFLKKHGPGLHHICFFVKDIDEWLTRYKKRGYEVIQNGTTNGKASVARFAYLRKKGKPDSDIIEFCDVRTYGIPVSRAFWNIGLGLLTKDLVKLN